jgi:hypothetical protein
MRASWGAGQLDFPAVQIMVVGLELKSWRRGDSGFTTERIPLAFLKYVLSEMIRPYRLACLVTHPIQYQTPLFRYLASKAEIDLTVLFLSDISTRQYRDPGFGVDVNWDVPLLRGYRYVFLPCLGRSDRLSSLRPLTHGLYQQLETGRFDALWVHGYAHQALMRAILIARVLGI